jgi:hypothetical protein
MTEKHTDISRALKDWMDGQPRLVQHKLDECLYEVGRILFSPARLEVKDNGGNTWTLPLDQFFFLANTPG